MPPTWNPSAGLRHVGVVAALLLLTAVAPGVALAGPPAVHTCAGRSFYVDYGAGSDANAGTSKSAPWKRAPGMVGFSGTYAHQAHDCFYFAGGVTWPRAVFPLRPAGSGDTGANDYYGPDPAWFSGTQWSRPVFDAGSAFIAGSMNSFINAQDRDRITFDNIEFTGWKTRGWTGGYGTCGGINIQGQPAYILFDHLYMHDWDADPNDTDCVFIQADTYGRFAGDTTIQNSVFTSGGETTKCIGTVKNSVFHDMVGMLFPCGHGEISGNRLYNCGYPTWPAGAANVHGDVIQINASDSGGTFLIHDNVIHSTGRDTNGNECESMLIGNPGETDYVWNNVIYNLQGNEPALVQNSLPGTAASFWNNTITGGGTAGSTTPSGYCLRAGHSTSGMSTIELRNNHCITTAGRADDPSLSAATKRVSNNVTQTPATASAQGFSSGATYAYAPPSGSAATVGAGTDLSAACSGALAALCAADSTYACSETADHQVACPARPATSARAARWDAGAFQYAAPGGADVTAPDTTISSGPPASTTATSASLAFTGSDDVTAPGGLTFACKLDAGAWGSCTSPAAYSGLATGSHTFQVRATDAAGNTDASPAAQTWTITSGSGASAWYVDPQATGSGTGTSWANAWTSPASIAWASVRPGDTVYFSGGSTSQTYTTSFTVGASGTSGSPIVLAPGTDPGHAGQVVFDFNADGDSATRTAVNLGSRNHVTVRGDVGGVSHWQINNLRNTGTATASAGIAGSGNTGITIRGVSFDNDNNPIRLTSSPGGNLVTANVMTRVRGDAAVAMAGSSGGLDSTTVSGNTIELACNNQGGGIVAGPDGIQTGSGVTVTGNRMREVQTSAYTTSDQHPDMLQIQGDNTRVSGNDFQNVGDSVIDFDTFADGTPNTLLVYNNVFRITTVIDPYPEFFRLYRSSGATLQSISNVKILNNVFADNDGGYRVIRFDTFGGNPTATGNEIKNNLFVNDGGGDASTPIIYVANSSAFTSSSFALDFNTYFNASGPQYVVFRGATSTVANWIAANEPHSRTSLPAFASYAMRSATNDFHLQGTDTTALDTGTSMAPVFTTDADGVARPAGAAWDMGPYERSGSVAPDTTAPDTQITSAPPATGNTTSATLAFTGTDNVAVTSYECKLDSGAWSTCTSPKTYTALTNGTHTASVRATDAAGNTDPTPATTTWTTDTTTPDTTAPETTVTDAPSGAVATATAAVAFRASEPATFECRIDAGPWAACTSPVSFPGLADGPHTAEVRATDASGNTDATPAAASWTVDTSPPDTTILNAPPASTTETTATFTFSGSDTVAVTAYQCRIDGGSWSACTSPSSAGALALGAHRYEVRAVDAAGNVDPTPAGAAWTIGSPVPQAPPAAAPADTAITTPAAAGPPDTAITRAPPATTSATTASFSFTSTASPAAFACRVDGGAWNACTSPRSFSARVGTHRFDVAAKDGAGQVDPSPASYSWTVTRKRRGASAATYSFVVLDPLGDAESTVNATDAASACAAQPSAARLGLRVTSFRASARAHRLRMIGRVPAPLRAQRLARVRIELRHAGRWRMLMSRRVRLRDGRFRLTTRSRRGRLRATVLLRCR